VPPFAGAGCHGTAPGDSPELIPKRHGNDHDVSMSDHSSLAPGAMDYMISIAPADIAATITWLTDEGWTPLSGMGGQQEAFGDVVIEFGKDGDAIKIVRDRRIWEMTFRFSDWRSWFDLDIVLDAKAGRTTWAPSERNPYEVEQLP
jgi:hypothetical protein